MRRLFTLLRREPAPSIADDPHPLELIPRTDPPIHDDPPWPIRQQRFAMVEGAARKIRTDATAARAIARQIEDRDLARELRVVISQAERIAEMARARQERGR